MISSEVRLRFTEDKVFLSEGQNLDPTDYSLIMIHLPKLGLRKVGLDILVQYDPNLALKYQLSPDHKVKLVKHWPGMLPKIDISDLSKEQCRSIKDVILAYPFECTPYGVPEPEYIIHHRLKFWIEKQYYCDRVNSCKRLLKLWLEGAYHMICRDYAYKTVQVLNWHLDIYPSGVIER